MFALLLTDHPTWGYCFKPAILKRGKTNFEISSFFFTMSDCESLTAMERKVVQEAFKTTEAYIMKMFVKDKMTNVEFQKNYGPCFKNYTIIQSSVEKTNHKIASLAIENNIPIFRKKKNLLYLYDSDSIHLSKELNTSIPRFDLEKDGTLRYSLLIDNQKDIIAISDLFKSPPPIVMSHNPCCMIAKNELFVFREESYNKISAFSVKSHISVPAQNVDEYMRKFVYKTLLERNAMTSGFECDYENCQPVPILTITEDLKNCATFRLDFLYGETRIDIDYEKKRIVELKKEVGNYHFKIYERNLESEKNYIDKLKYFGLQFFNRFFYIDYKKENSAKNIIDFIQVNRFALSDYRIKQDLKGSTYILEKPTFVSELIEKDIDWFELKGKVTVDGIDIDFRKIRHNIIEGIREYKLPDGRIVILPEELFSKFSEVFRKF